MTGEFSAAIHIIVFLNHKKDYMTSEEIAKNVCTNPARIRKITSKLKKANLIATKEGSKSGGCIFIKNPTETTLLQILDALDENTVVVAKHTGDEDMDCLIASGMAGIMDSLAKNMNDNCREYLSKITVDDIDKKIFFK